ncbi:hypothetical protein [Nocardia sp. NBC_01327]|uniref:hypothetical protein n=1 Tax=Nocardia sp. NBC_01327 TaxID=2903593 RepID=UPI002E10613D|nr:hypothetical protein OG326_21110 [Nocardia sp. NBC_01327]
MSIATGEAGEVVTLQPGPVVTLDIQRIETEDENADVFTIAYAASELVFTLPAAADGASQLVAAADASDKSSWWAIEAAPSSTLRNTYTIRCFSQDDCYLTAQAPFPGAAAVSSATSFPWLITQLKG